MATRSSTRLRNAVGEENDNGSFCDNRKRKRVYMWKARTVPVWAFLMKYSHMREKI